MTSLNTKGIFDAVSVRFGTSGVRGLVEEFSDEVCMAFTIAFLDAMRDFTFSKLAIGIDNRPSSPQMANAIASLLTMKGIEPLFYGVIPTPALAYKSISDNIPAIMVTGSHIPFDRNGLKFYRPDGEITKQDEQRILSADIDFEVASDLVELPVLSSAADFYIERYVSLFDTPVLAGKRIGIYEHSSSGRDLYKIIFEKLGAEVICFGRSDVFVPIDTEAVSKEDKELALKWSQEHSLDAIFSTDGDGDRPLIADENGIWLRGDIIGLLVAKLLKIECLAVPVNCNTAIERSQLFREVKRTKIGSPYVIAEFSSLLKNSNSVAGFEANGGFLLASDIKLSNKKLTALPTRDALLSIVVLLSLSKLGNISGEVDVLPKRFTESYRVMDVPLELSKMCISNLTANPLRFLHVIYEEFEVLEINDSDGVRLKLANKDIIHIRASGNAPELRCYVESDSESNVVKLISRVLTHFNELKQQ